MIKPRLRAIFGACVICLGGSACATNYYVNSGMWYDTYNGTSATFAFKTIAQVNAKQADGTIVSGDTVIFACNKKYTVANTPLKLKTGVTYKSEACGANLPVLTGAVSLTGLSWAPYSGAGVPAGAQIFSAQLPTSVSVDGVSVALTGRIISQLMDPTSSTSSKLMQRARHPNVGGGSYPSVDANGNANSRYFKIGQNTPAHSGSVYPLHLARSTWSGGQGPALDATNYVGAEVYVRQYDWLMSRYKVSGVNAGTDTVDLVLDGSRGEFQDETGFAHDKHDPATQLAGGFWLENKRWMLDAPGEWFYDVADRRLYVWRSDNQVPTSATTYVATVGSYGITGGMTFGASPQDPGKLDENAGGIVNLANNFRIQGLEIQDTILDGISVLGQPYPYSATSNWLNTMVIDGVTVRRAGRSGIAVRSAFGHKRATGVARPTIQNSLIEDANQFGITVSADSVVGAYTPKAYLFGSTEVLIDNNTINRTGLYGDGVMPSAISATGDNILQHPSGGANQVSAGSTINRNKVNVAGFRGIEVDKNSKVTNNVITKACSVLDDCGAIYAIRNIGRSGDAAAIADDEILDSMNVEFYDNFIFDVPGSVDGRHSGVSMAYGVYLDYYVKDATIRRNFIRGAKASGAVFSGSVNVNFEDNTLVADKGGVALTVSQSRNAQAGGHVVANNIMLAPDQSSLLIEHTSTLAPEAGQSYVHPMASYSGNRYGAKATAAFGVMTADPIGGTQFPLIKRFLTFDQWKGLGSAFASDGVVGLPAASFYTKPLTLTEFTGGNGNFSASTLDPWALTGDSPQLGRQLTQTDCAVGQCVDVTPNFVPSWKPRKQGSMMNGSLMGSGGVTADQKFVVQFQAKSLSSDSQEFGESIELDLVNYSWANNVNWAPMNKLVIRAVSIDKQWRTYLVPLQATINGGYPNVHFSFNSNASVALDEVKVFSVDPASDPGNEFHVVTNTTLQTVNAPCPTLAAGQTYGDFRLIGDQSVSFACGTTTVRPGGSKVFVMSK